MAKASDPLAVGELLPKGFLWTPYIGLFFTFYVLMCSFFRFQRRDAMHKRFNFQDRLSLSRMTNVEAQAIIADIAELEFPKIFATSIQFALFKTYGIPTISQILVDTRQFSTPEHASKRYADTAVLISEFTGHHPKSERVIKSLARMNYIHSRYQKAGKISNDDLLYTLSVFITEPVTWCSKYEWRTLTDMEICALGTFWKSIGDAMGIVYKGRLAHAEWINGLQFYEEIAAWAEEYEVQYMVPAKSNKQTADELVPLLLFYVPFTLREAASHMVGVLMGGRLRKAMIFPTPTKGYFQTLNVILETRRWVLRYLCLPRPNFMRVREIGGDPDPKTGRYFSKNYLAHPYYNKPGFINRWGPEAWFVRATGGHVPGSRGYFYIPEGYKFEEVGPKSMKNKGLDETKLWEEKLKAERPAGCPFAFAR